MADDERCIWDDYGFAAKCGEPEEAHCPFKTADDDCELLHHPFTVPKWAAP